MAPPIKVIHRVYYLDKNYEYKWMHYYFMHLVRRRRFSLSVVKMTEPSRNPSTLIFSSFIHSEKINTRFACTESSERAIDTRPSQIALAYSCHKFISTMSSSNTSSTLLKSSSRIRQRPLHQHVVFIAVAVVVASLSSSSSFITPCSAFYPPVLAVTSKALNGNGNIGNNVYESSSTNQHQPYVKQQPAIMPKSKQSWTAMDQAVSSSEKELRMKDASKWLSWLKFGNRRQVGDIRMRDPEELGGVPRSDRYSSR
jgi:hypothetical protein